jgi:hypothetical protein
MNALPILAAVSGEAMVKQLLWIFALIVIALIVWLLGRYFFPKLKAPEMLLTIWDGLFVLLGALILINFILSLFGHPLLNW